MYAKGERKPIRLGNPSDSKSESAQIGHKDLDVVKIFSILILPLLKRSRTSFCIV